VFTVRLIITFCCLAVSGAGAAADTIVLKNGDRIIVDSVREHDGRVQYWIGTDTLTIPKAIVARIESGPAASAAATARSATAAEMPPVHEPLPGSDSPLMARVVRNGAVDVFALKAIEAEGIPAQSAAANAIAASLEENKNNVAEAARYLESALRFLPDHPVYLQAYALDLIRLGRPAEALSQAQQAASVAGPQSASAFATLGYAYYKNDRNREAIVVLKKSLQLRPDDRVKAFLEKVERESKTEADFREKSSNHFTLRYEGTHTADNLGAQILGTLEDDYRDLQNDLGGAPKTIFVSLYTDQAFFDVTQAPSWSAALNDGKIRIPISGVQSMTPQLAAVLRHELTHSFIQQIAHGRAPHWLNEGIAQIEEGRTTAAFGSRLSAVFSSGHQIPLSQLEGDFTSFSSDEAAVAYAEGLAATEYIRNTWGMSDLARIVQRLGNGQSIESAMRTTIHAGYGELENEITVYLKKNYGL
jgi:tetratricopeptide (TPR) repeat protein